MRMKPYAPSFRRIGGQQHRAHGGRFGVRVGQPRVEREHRHLDREAEEQPGEQQHLRAVRRCRRRCRFESTTHVEGLRPSTGRTAPGSDSSIIAEPNSVNRKNLIDAYSRFGPPQTPIMKNIGSRTISKKMKKRMRSCGDERAVHPHLEQQDQREERLRVVRLGEVVPRVDDAHHGDEHRQRRAAGARCRRCRGGSGCGSRRSTTCSRRTAACRPVVVEVGEDRRCRRPSVTSDVTSVTILISSPAPGGRAARSPCRRRDEDRQGQCPVVEPVHRIDSPSELDVGDEQTARLRSPTAANSSSAYRCTRPDWM